MLQARWLRPTLHNYAEAHRHLCASNQRIIQAVFIHYDALNKYEHYAEDMEDTKQKLDASDKPWEFRMHPLAKDTLGFLAAENISAVSTYFSHRHYCCRLGSQHY